MRILHPVTAVVCLLALCSGCSIKRVAINKLGNALASSGTTFEGDDDPELVAAAIPFGLKLYESLLAESPKHTGLLLSAAAGFTQYAYAFVDLKAEGAREESVDKADALHDRARRLYLRANRYGMRGLESRYPGFGAALDKDAATALKRVRKQDVQLLYWTAASLGLAISSSKASPEMIAQLPLVETIVERVAELDETFDNGAVPEFLITLEAARSGIKPEEQQKAMRQQGGLDWSQVRPKIIQAFQSLPDVKVLLFEPAGAPKAEVMVKERRIPNMTPGRAVLVELMSRYLTAVMDPFITLLEIHKLMYFMQEAGEDLRLKYEKATYGPYAQNLRHVLSLVEGHLIRGYGDAEDDPEKPIELLP